MSIINEMRLDFPAIPENEGFARMVISGFMLPLNPTLEQLADVKTAVSEAVTNAIIHGYGNGRGTVRMHARYDEAATLTIDVIAAASPMWNTPASRFTPPPRGRSDPAWALL